MNALGIPTRSTGKCSRDQWKPLMIRPCQLSPPNSLMVPQLQVISFKKSQQQRWFQGSLILLACPNYSEAGHKDKIHQPAAGELSLAENMTDFMTHFPLITKSYVCMHAETHQPSKWDNFWKMISLLFIQSSTQIPTPYSAGGPLHTISTMPWQTTLFHVSLKRQGLCSYDIITHPTHSQARIPSLFTHSDPHSVSTLAIFKFSKTLAEIVNFLIWRGRTEQEHSLLPEVVPNHSMSPLTPS